MAFRERFTESFKRQSPWADYDIRTQYLIEEILKHLVGDNGELRIDGDKQMSTRDIMLGVEMGVAAFIDKSNWQSGNYLYFENIFTQVLASLADNDPRKKELKTLLDKSASDNK